MFEKAQLQQTDPARSSSDIQGRPRDPANALVGWSSHIPALSGTPVQKMEDKDIDKKKKVKQAEFDHQTGVEEEKSSYIAAGNRTQMPEDIQTKMENAFGADFSKVQVHSNDTSAKEMGALAYAHGNNIHFAPGQYNPSSGKGLELIGHELTHVVQQRQGRVAATTQTKGVAVNDDFSLEQEADRMGRYAASGTGTSLGNNSSAPAKPVHQFYTKIDAASQKTNQWDHGQDLRVADTGLTATEDVASKVCYADKTVMDQANRKLKARNSGVVLEAQSSVITGSAPNGSGKKTLHRIVPKMSFSASGTGLSQTSWEDCGRMSREVMGNTGMDESPYGIFKGSGGNLEESSKSYNPKEHKGNILVSLGLGSTPAAAVAAYDALSAADKKNFDEKHGINEFASPVVGEAFGTDNATTFNFHWGGVVLKSGGDSVTLENFFKGNTYGHQESNWYMNTYGPANKPGQTWDEQWNSSFGKETFTSATSTRSITGQTNTNDVRLVDAPANWNDKSHYDLLQNGTPIKKLAYTGASWMKVEVLGGAYSGKTGYIMEHLFTGN